MSVGKITSTSEFDAALSKAGGALVVVDFSASWCGPCRRLEPLYEEMARKHSPAGVKFFKVMEDDAKDVIAEQRISAFPTVRFYLKKAQVDEVQGADPAGIEARIEKHKGSAVASFAGAGASLGGKSASSAEEMRLARMRAMKASAGAGGAGASSSSAAAAPAPVVSSAVSAAAARALAAAEHEDEGADAAAAAALAASRASAAAAPRPAPAAHAAKAAFTPRADLLSQLVAMEMSRERSYRALQATGNGSVEAAVDWLFTHGEEAGLDDPVPGFTASAGADAAAGAPAPAEHAAPGAPAHDGSAGGHAADAAAAGGAGGAAPAAAAPASASSGSGAGRPDLSEGDRQAIADAERLLAAESAAGAASGEPPRKMTPAEVDALIKKRREERAAREKEEARLAELRRREDGAKSVEMAEQIAALQRKAAVDKQMRDKEATEAERRRLQLELLRDKIERHSKLHGTVPRELMDQLAALENMKAGGGAGGGAAAGGAGSDPSTNPTASAKVALAAMGALGARGATCAQTVRTLCHNALANPGEAKYRSVSLANERIKERLGSVPGGIHAMLAAGWARDEEAKTLTMADPAAKADKLRAVIGELDAALAAGAFKDY